MNGIDDEILLKYSEYKPSNKIVNFRKAAVIAVSICLLVVAGSVIRIMNNVSVGDGVTVNCTVTYEDGTTEEAAIALMAEYHTYDELDDAFGEDYKTGIYKDGAIIMTFELL